ncbi:MAG: DUF4296 domain-containing protein [Chitinophagaceae bacterium]|nr:DUF4296 domain-containing protein [Chitinophagaceae bacterium]
MRLVPLFLFFIIGFAACGNKDRVPGDIIPPDKMEAVLWDMMRADQFLADYVLNKDSSAASEKEKKNIRMYQQIFSFHEVTKEEFSKSFDYYRAHPVRLRTIMDSIQNKKLGVPVVAAVSANDTAKKAPDTINRSPIPATLPVTTRPVDTSRARKKIQAIKPD